MIPTVTAAAIIYPIITSASNRRRHSIIPPLLNVEAAWNKLKNSLV
jgi:hypothetical protein